MPKLDIRGQIAAAQIAFYVPIALITIYLVFRYAFRRDAGWFFLFLFAGARIAQGALLVVAETVKNAKPSLSHAAYIIDYSALSLLLFSSLGFIGMAGQHTYSENPRVTIILRMVGVLTLGGLGLSIAGGILAGDPSANASTATAIRRAGVCVFVAVYVMISGIYIGSWTYRWHLRSYRRNLLRGLSVAIPILGVRMAYAVIAVFSSSDLLGAKPSSNKTLAKLNPITGQWVLYLVLSLVMEYLTAAIYLFSSTILAQRHRY